MHLIVWKLSCIVCFILIFFSLGYRDHFFLIWSIYCCFFLLPSQNKINLFNIIMSITQVVNSSPLFEMCLRYLDIIFYAKTINPIG